MKFLVFSDAHGATDGIRKALGLHPDAAGAFFLGDGAREVLLLAETVKFPFYCVAGNCDFASTLPQENILTVGGHTIFYTHGHRYGVKTGLGGLLAAAKRKGADIALFGHTHEPLERFEEGIRLLNPGSIGHGIGGGSCGILDIAGEDILISCARIR